MRKPALLRAHLAAHITGLAANPENMVLLIEQGAVATKPNQTNTSLSYEWRYTLTLILLNYTQNPDTLMVPLLIWIHEHQPDLIQNPDNWYSTVPFEAEVIDHNTVDIQVKLKLSERVLVTPLPGGGHQCEHVPEPDLPDLTGPTDWSIYLKGQLLAEGSNG